MLNNLIRSNHQRNQVEFFYYVSQKGALIIVFFSYIISSSVHFLFIFIFSSLLSESNGEIGWTFTLIIVSIISALLGAIIMIIVLRCRR